MNEILERDFMSSEDSDYEEREEDGAVKRTLVGYKVKRLPWERKKMRVLKKKMDNAYFESLSKHSRGMIKERKDGQDSLRPCPSGPEWAVRKNGL